MMSSGQSMASYTRTAGSDQASGTPPRTRATVAIRAPAKKKPTVIRGHEKTPEEKDRGMHALARRPTIRRGRITDPGELAAIDDGHDDEVDDQADDRDGGEPGGEPDVGDPRKRTDDDVLGVSRDRCHGADV